MWASCCRPRAGPFRPCPSGARLAPWYCPARQSTCCTLACLAKIGACLQTAHSQPAFRTTEQPPHFCKGQLCQLFQLVVHPDGVASKSYMSLSLQVKSIAALWAATMINARLLLLQDAAGPAAHERHVHGQPQCLRRHRAGPVCRQGQQGRHIAPPVRRDLVYLAILVLL